MRYIPRPRLIYYDNALEEDILTPETVHVDWTEPEYTGLCDHHGNDLYRDERQGWCGFRPGGAQ